MSDVMQQVGALIVYAPFIMALCLGLVEAAKRAGAKGQVSLYISLALGAAFGVFAYLAEYRLPVSFAGWFAVIAFGVLCGLAASGIYDFARGKVTRQEPPVQ